MLPTLNFTIILIACLGYIYGRLYSRVLVVVSWLGLLPLFLFFHDIHPVNAIAAILVLNVFLYGTTRARVLQDTLGTESRLETEELEQRKQGFSSEFEELDTTEKKEKAREIFVVNLYEFTKKMSQSLKFEDVFPTLANFLRDKFEFRRSELIILKEQGGFKEIDRVYELWGSLSARGREEREGAMPQEFVRESKLDVKSLLNLAGKKKEVCINRSQDPAAFRALGLDTEVETFLAVPLLSENITVALLVVEDLPHEALDEFVILSMQFALEIKRLLLYKTVESLAITDGLTNVYVRRYFLERLEEELIRSKRYNLKFSFLMADLDYFKDCNDNHGHLVGDVVLKDVSCLIKDAVREIDLVARYGGEEFSLLLPETNKAGGVRVAERIRKRVKDNVFKAYDETLKITISVGVATYPDDGKDLESLIENADMAMYKAKKGGRDRVCVS